MNTIARAPRLIEIQTETAAGEVLEPWTRYTFAEFKEANPDLAGEIAADLVVFGASVVGGGAAPIVRIRHA